MYVTNLYIPVENIAIAHKYTKDKCKILLVIKCIVIYLKKQLALATDFVLIGP
jgi:hypothetical protein